MVKGERLNNPSGKVTSLSRRLSGDKWLAILAFIFAMALPATLMAQQYSFQVPENKCVVTVNPDASIGLDYSITFANQGQPIDVIDVGMPNGEYDLAGVSADLDGTPLSDIRPSEYVKPGVEVHLGSKAIPAGSSGTLHLKATVADMVFGDDKDANYASMEFSPTWYGADFTSGSTHLVCEFILPEGVKPEEPRWHSTQPTSMKLENGRVVYTWELPDASPSGQYKFGASFPRKVMQRIAEVPREPKQNPVTLFFSGLIRTAGGCMPCFFFMLFPALTIFGVFKNRQRRLQYLPATVGIEGTEVRRGLTVPEVAVLMQQPVDKVMALVLFGMVRKNLLKVTGRNPLKLELVPGPAPQFSYEEEFAKAVKDDGKVSEAEAARVLTDLIKKVQDKMKGYSRAKSVAYYQEIMRKAWDQVGAEDYSQAFEWLILDKEFSQHATERYGDRPMPVPVWWPTIYTGHSYGGSGGGAASGGGLPNLTSAANGIVSGIEGFGHDLVNSVPGLASRVTDKTNPIPVSSGGHYSGGGCACACACAGCACACAGGGR